MTRAPIRRRGLGSSHDWACALTANGFKVKVHVDRDWQTVDDDVELLGDDVGLHLQVTLEGSALLYREEGEGDDLAIVYLTDECRTMGPILLVLRALRSERRRARKAVRS